MGNRLRRGCCAATISALAKTTRDPRPPRSKGAARQGTGGMRASASDLSARDIARRLAQGVQRRAFDQPDDRGNLSGRNPEIKAPRSDDRGTALRSAAPAPQY